MMTLKTLCQNANIHCQKRYENIEIQGITDSSSEVRTGFLYVVKVGHKTSGYSHIGEAKANGAVAILCEKKPDKPTNMPIILCKNVNLAGNLMLLAFYGNPEKRLSIIGITGTKGKTTSAISLAHILSENGIAAASVGTLGIRFRDSVTDTPNTTPSMFILAPELKRLLDSGCRVVVIEMSSLGLKDERLLGLPIKAGILTNIGQDHIGCDAHPDFSDYLSSKKRLFTDYGVTLAFYPITEPYAKNLLSSVKDQVSVSFDESDKYGVKILSKTPLGTWFSYQNTPFYLSLPGDFSLIDCLLSAFCCRMLFDLEPVKCFTPLSSLSVPGHLEIIEKNGIRFIIDFAHNAMSVKALCDFCRSIGKGCLIGVFGSVGDREFARRFDLSKTAEEALDISVITEDNPGDEPLFCILSDMYSAFHDKTKAKVIPRRFEAVKYAVSIANPGDTVLLLGKGNESHQFGKGAYRYYSEKDALFCAFS